jgi:hypothetical protein
VVEPSAQSDPAQWPTRLPGIRFCARGTLTYRAPADTRAGGKAAAQAAARLALDELGRDITRVHLPEQLDTAQEKLTLAAAHWHTAKDNPDLWLRARITLMLTEQDAAWAQRYQDALREVTLQLAQEKERRELFRQTVFDKPDVTPLVARTAPGRAGLPRLGRLHREDSPAGRHG